MTRFQNEIIIGCFYNYNMNCACFLNICPKRFTMANITLFSASKHTHCALVVCDSELLVTVQLYTARFWISTEVITLLFNYKMAAGCHIKPLQSELTFCVHQTTMHQFIVSLYAKPYMLVAYVFCVYLCSCIIILCYFTCIFYAVVRQISMLFVDNKDFVLCNLYSVLWQCDWDLLRATAVTRGW